ncbi:Gibberellin 3-beta-dioxygenase 1 [Linum grandiflorum]
MNTNMANISSNTMSTTTTVPFDFDSIRTVPETHVWPPPGDGEQVFSIPVVDFSAPSEQSRKLIAEACEEWGMFQLTNHGIPSELLKEVEAQARRLFALPASRKLKALRSPDGVSGYGLPRISQFFEKHMWNEGDVIEDYQQRMTELAAKLFRLILNSLNTSEQEVRRMSSPETTMASLQLNSYPPCPDPTRVMGMAPHTDTSLLTLVYQGNVKGLQIFKETVGGGKWGMVPPVAGALTVNVGDLLNVISNGRFRTVRHRVVLKEAMMQRVSVALFYSPTPEFVLPPSGVVSGEFEAPMNRSLTVKEYRGLKYKSYKTAQAALDG